MGDEVTDTVLVFGWSSTLVVALAPWESVAVNRISIFAGYSWSGAVNVAVGAGRLLDEVLVTVRGAVEEHEIPRELRPG